MSLKNNGEWTRWLIAIFINVLIIVASIIMAYGNLDKRLVVVETRQEQKVDGERMQMLLKVWKDEIIKEIKTELKNLEKRK